MINKRKRKHSGKKPQKRDISDTQVNVGNHNSKFSSLQEAAAAVCPSAAMGQRRPLVDVPHGASVVLKAGQEEAPLKWPTCAVSDMREASCH